MRRIVCLLAGLALAGCNLFPNHAPAPAPQVHYVLGKPYRGTGGWHYPHVQFDYDESGLAVPTTRVSGLTADGEAADAMAMAAAHDTLQLPAVALITNLDNGLQQLVRINDRGPDQRGRLIGLTPRVMRLLGAAGQATMKVRVQVQDSESRRLASDFAVPDAPPLPVAAAPTGSIQAESLPPPPGAVQSARVRVAAAGPRPVARAAVAAAEVPLRLPEHLERVRVKPAALFVEAATFTQLQYAELMRKRLAVLGAQTSTDYNAPRDRAFRLRVGPLPTVAVADAMLARMLAMGVEGARIIVD